MPSLIDSVSGRYGSENELLSGEAQFQTEAAREQPRQFQMEQQRFQMQQRQARAAAHQAEILNEQMRRQMDPQVRLYNANLLTGMIKAATDPMIKARLQAYQGLMMNSPIAPETIMAELAKIDEFKVLLEEARAQQATAQAALSGTGVQINKKVANLLPDGSGGAASPGPTGIPTPGGTGGTRGWHITTTTPDGKPIIGPDGKPHVILVDGGNNFIRDLGVAP